MTAKKKPAKRARKPAAASRQRQLKAVQGEMKAGMESVNEVLEQMPFADQASKIVEKLDGGFTRKELRFVEEYIIDLNGAAAARRAGYSEATAKSIACELLAKPRIQDAIADEMEARAERTQVTKDYVVFNLREVVERCLQRAPVMVRRGKEMVQLVDEDDRHVWQFNSMGATSALGLLGRHLKMFTDKVEHSGSVTLEEILTASREGK